MTPPCASRTVPEMLPVTLPKSKAGTTTEEQCDATRNVRSRGKVRYHRCVSNLTDGGRCGRGTEQGGRARRTAKPSAGDRTSNDAGGHRRPDGGRHPPLFGQPDNGLRGKTGCVLESRLLLTSCLRSIGCPPAGTISRHYRANWPLDSFFSPSIGDHRWWAFCGGVRRWIQGLECPLA